MKNSVASFKKYLGLWVILLSSMGIPYIQAQTITTIAGNGNAGYNADGIFAIMASLNRPTSITGDAYGNMYIADAGNNRIRKVSSNGMISTVAGNGTAGYSGDSGLAINANLSAPMGIAFDLSGNMYIAEMGNYRIRKVTPSGVIYTVVGNGTRAYSGDGGFAIAASLSDPVQVICDPIGNLYIADMGNHRIRKVTTDGKINTIAGDGYNSYGDGRYNGDSIPATTASLYWPTGMALDNVGNLYFADSWNYRIRKVNTNGMISTIAGTGTQGFNGDGGLATAASIKSVQSICFDFSGNLFLTDFGNHRIRMINNNGIITTIAGNGVQGFSGDGGNALLASLNHPVGIVVDPTGNVYFSDRDNGRIREVAKTSTPIILSGTVKTANGKAINNVNMNIVGNKNFAFKTDYLGNFSFPLTTGNYTILPSKNNDILKSNGISTIDAALIQSHILSKAILNSPYKIIAADVSGDNKVSALDIVYIKRFILGIDTCFPNNKLWRFVDSNYAFTDMNNPFPVKDSISYTGLSASKNNQSFIGMKLGDVNCDWNPALAKTTIVPDKTIELMYDVDLAKYIDKYIRVPIKVSHFKDMMGLQFTLQFNTNELKYCRMENNILPIETATNHADNGMVSFLWLDPYNEKKTLDDGTVMMVLVFERASELVTIHSPLSINSNITAMEAFDKDYQLHNIMLRPAEANLTVIENESFTIIPNPVLDRDLNIQIHFKESKRIEINVFDNVGKVILKEILVGKKGNNSFKLHLPSHLTTGVYYVKTIGLEGDEVKKVMVK